jgi:AAA domain
MSALERHASPMIGYIVQSLVDAARGAPSDVAVLEAVHIWIGGQTDGSRRPPVAIPCSSSVMFREGRIEPQRVAHLFASARAHGVPPRTCEVIIAPEVFVAEATGGAGSQRGPRALIPLLIAAEVDEHGVFTPRGGALPWVPRRFLEPHGLTGPTIGAVDDLEDAIASLDEGSIRTWEHLEQACIRVYERVTGAAAGRLVVPGYQQVSDLALVVAEGDGLNISRAIRAVLEELPRDRPLPPLLQTYLHGAPQPSPPLDLVSQQRLAATHLGQMGNAHSLSPNQRQTLHHVLNMCAEESGQILAVNGPPGTGKTTLLQSVVASLWVQRALAGGAPPVIVATSTNNQAVTNILDSFGAAGAVEHRSTLERRWLEGIDSHGVFHVGSTRAPGGYQFISGSKTNLPSDVLDDVSRSRMEARFVACAREWFQFPVPHVPAAMDALHGELRRACSAVATIADAMHRFRRVHSMVSHADLASEARERLEERRAEQERALSELSAQRSTFSALVGRRSPWLRWLSAVVWTVWPSAFERVRTLNRKSAALFADHGDPHTDRACHDAFATAERRLFTVLGDVERDLDESRRVEQALRNAVSLGSEVPLDSILSGVERELDRGARYRAFWLATHYWEARWLVEAAKAKDKAAPKELRLAMLAPCHVATCYSLPAVHRRLTTSGEGQIDLLLLDEAGQVSPEVGAAAFALATNALVVGDTYQLEPVWGIQPALDQANVRRFGLDCEEVRERGLSAAAGSVMQVAQRACNYRQFPAPHPSGLFLTEHRRCRDPIIAYCNELTYGGVLEPLRGPHGARVDLPAMMFMPVVGKASRRGGSRMNVMEAEAIAKWIAEHLPNIAAAYGADDDDTVLSLIGIVTPFRAQSEAVSKAMRARGLPRFTVGTVHSLQGAERAIVIFSPTYSSSERPGRLFFDMGPNMLNVAVSRAKDHFIVFGDPGIIRRQNVRTPSSLLAAHLEQAPWGMPSGEARV